MKSHRSQVFIRGLVVLVAGVVTGLVIASLAPTAPTADAAVRQVEGVSVVMGCEGEKVYGTDFFHAVSAEGEPQVEFSHDPNQLVMPDGTRIGNVEKIEGTDSFREPNPVDPARTDVVYEVAEFRPGEFVVIGVIACDYEKMHDRTGYQP